METNGSEAKAREVKPLHGSRRTSAEQEISRWLVSVEDDVRVADLLTPAFWRAHVRGLKRLDEVTVYNDGETWKAVLTVCDVGANGARMALDYYIELPKAGNAGAVQGMPSIAFHGPLQGYSVMRGGEVIGKGFPTEEAARAFRSEFMERHRTV